MKYKVIERKNPQQPNAPGKFYASPVHAGVVTLKDFAGVIEKSSSLTRGDIMNVLQGFVDQLPIFLKAGMSVRLEGFAVLRLALSSDGADVFEDFNADHIRRARIMFTPSPELKRNLLDISFERVNE